jgi:hypothetical protein
MNNLKHITPDEYILSMIKHKAWVYLNKFIEKKTERDECEPEMAGFWKDEFFECETEDDINHFLKGFPKFWKDDTEQKLLNCNDTEQFFQFDQ